MESIINLWIYKTINFCCILTHHFSINLLWSFDYFKKSLLSIQDQLVLSLQLVRCHNKQMFLNMASGTYRTFDLNFSLCVFHRTCVTVFNIEWQCWILSKVFHSCQDYQYIFRPIYNLGLFHLFATPWLVKYELTLLFSLSPESRRFAFPVCMSVDSCSV